MTQAVSTTLSEMYETKLRAKMSSRIQIRKRWILEHQQMLDDMYDIACAESGYTISKVSFVKGIFDLFYAGSHRT